MKLLYKPFGLLASIASGLAAGAIFTQLWRAIADGEDAPTSPAPGHDWSEVVAAGMVRGAVFGAVKAGFDRAGAKAFAHATGRWPA